ncbi:MAG: ABC transporter substrate-binding protein [Burkholderiales bacterium]|nr:ABC transporter substrate-binding protein [Burkholderiales bacterium]
MKMLIGCAIFVWALATSALAADITIGQSTPLTGANADLGNDIRNGARAYFEKVNAAGGINGNKIVLVSLNDKNDTKIAAENTKKLLTDNNAVALFGYASATLSIPAMPFVKESRVPFFAPFTGADTIRKQNEFVYTVRATYNDEIEKIINFWGNLGTTRVTVLHYDDAVGKQNFDTVARTLQKFNKQPTGISIKRNADLPDDVIKRVADSNPQIIVVTTLYAPAAEMVKKLRAANLQYMVTSLSFVGASQLAKALGPEAAGISVALTVPTAKSMNVPVIKECVEAWRALGQKETMSVTAIEACIAAKVLVEGVRKAGKDVTRESLQRALSALGRVDVGGHVVEFKPGFHHGGKFVDIAVILANGELRS